MERIINLTIETLPEGVDMGSSNDSGLVVQGTTTAELIEYALGCVQQIIELRA